MKKRALNFAKTMSTAFFFSKINLDVIKPFKTDSMEQVNIFLESAMFLNVQVFSPERDLLEEVFEPLTTSVTYAGPLPSV